MNLILFGEPYYIRMVLRDLDTVYLDCANVYIPDLKISDRLNCIKANIKVLNKENLKQSGNFDEMLFFIGDDTKELIPKFLSKVTPTEKFIWINKFTKAVYPTNIFDESILRRRASVLSLSIGRSTQQYNCELLINKHLKNMGVKFYQQFSHESTMLLSQQNFNFSCYNILKKYTPDYDLFVGGVSVSSVQELVDGYSSACNVIRKMNPDSVVISCSNSPYLLMNDIKIAIDILKYRFNIKQVIIMVSEYYFSPSISFPVRNYQKTEYLDCDLFNMSNLSLKEELIFMDRLLSTVYLPSGVIPIGFNTI